MLGDPSWLEEMRAGLASLPDDRVIELRRRASQLGKVAKAVMDMIASLVCSRGEIMHSDGSRLVAREEPRSALDVPLAWPILAARLPREALIGAIKLGKGDVKKAAGREWREIEAELQERGALRESKYTKVMEARA